MRYLHLSLALVIVGLGFLTWGNVAAQGTPINLCINDYQDTNRNGTPDAGEEALPNVQVFLTGTDVGSLTTSSDENCFLSLAAGEYTLTFELPEGFEATTPTTVTLTLSDSANSVDIGAAPLQASTPSNTICLIVFFDENTNGQRESTEGLVAGIDANLLQDAVIIATKVTDASDKTCFEGLGLGNYQVQIPPSPNHVMVTHRDSAFSFNEIGKRVVVSFGLKSIAPIVDNPDVVETGGIEYDNQTRLLIAALGALLMVAFMGGLGMLLVGLIRH